MNPTKASFLLAASMLAACSHDDSSSGNYTVQPNPQPAVDTAVPIVAQDHNWTWVDVPQSFCGNGNITGFAVNLSSSSNDLVIVYEGGGACYDTLSCYVLDTASYIATGYDETTFASEEQLFNHYLLLNRQDPNNPFASANIAYIPYCTGDIHDGNQVVLYQDANQATHHTGFRNGQVFTQLLAATLPSVQHVWVTGFSAGGFGAVFHYEDTQTQFPNARVDLIDDSGSSFPGLVGHPSWNVELPTNCPTCSSSDLTSLVKSFSEANPKSRFGVLSYTQDTVLPAFFQISETQFTTDLQQYESLMDSLPNVKYFVYTGQGHVLLQDDALTIGAENITTWVSQMANEDPNWTSAK